MGLLKTCCQSTQMDIISPKELHILKKQKYTQINLKNILYYNWLAETSWSIILSSKKHLFIWGKTITKSTR